MKLLIFSILVLCLTLSCFSQQVAPEKEYHPDNYLKKSRTQKTIASLLIGGAATTFIIALAHDANNLFTDAKSFTGLYILSGALLTGSIILFSASSENRRRYRRAAAYMKMEKTRLPVAGIHTPHAFPALALSLDL